MTFQTPKAALFFTFLASVSLLQPVTAFDPDSLQHARRQPNCSCNTISATDPLVLTPLAQVYRQSPSACRSLGRQLEAKRQRASRKWQLEGLDGVDIEFIESAPTQLLEAPSPIHTEVLLAATGPDSTEVTIVCRPVPFEGHEEWWRNEADRDALLESTTQGSGAASDGTFALVCLVVLVVLGVLAEVIEWVLFRSHIWNRRSVHLSGSEKVLYTDEEQFVTEMCSDSSDDDWIGEKSII